ncbi:hypothetical protein KHA80_20310 [Anaerobacillus sp. HL2]|nr:hypothetical protein KHA80_20310 [Anaerobacillus sp. HL2]
MTLDETYGFALTDLTTGENFVTLIQGSYKMLLTRLLYLVPKKHFQVPTQSEEKICIY